MVRYSSDEVTVLTEHDAEAGDQAQASQCAHLIVLSGSNVGRVHALEQPRTVLGRDDDCQLQLMDPGISRRHAEIVRVDDGRYVVRDLGSRNGTYANNDRLEAEHPLNDGDRIQVGLVTILKFTLSDAFEANYAQTMYDAALRDGLTGAFNRRYFDQRMDAEFSFTRRHGNPTSLLLLDLDHFKQVNDTYGHPTGDAVLKDLSQRLCDSVRAEDVVVRYGGEEFVVICRDTSLQQASALAERIRHAVASDPLDGVGQLISVTVSVGVVAIPDPEIDGPDSMLSCADQALYEAKRRGRNCVVSRRE